MSDAPLPDNLENFLQAPPSEPPEAATRAAILARTLALLPRPRIGAHGLIGVAIAASLLLALLIGWYLMRFRQIPSIPVKEMVEQKVAPAPPKEPPAPAPKQVAPPVAVASPADPRKLEWTAFDAENDEERARLYFLAGNLYLDKHDDVDAALRCYQQALSYCDARDLEFNPDDNWLVLALKRDHRKEK